jgi:murein DD-endopeptidase MepM/ murein hydrolase activator NlpD
VRGCAALGRAVKGCGQAGTVVPSPDYLGTQAAALTHAEAMRLVIVGVASGLVGSALIAGPAAAPGAGTGSPVAPPLAAVTYAPPVSPTRVVRPFAPPTTRFGPGHLGVDLSVTPGSAVRAAGAGIVTFAGSVAGRGLVVVLHADGVSTEYEPLRPIASAGTTVRRGQVLGRVSGTHGNCAPGRCLHWGARRGDDYLDPLLLLRPLGPVRLLPWTSGF